VNEETRIDSEELIKEIARYLVAVDAFRAECCEPTWLPELASQSTSGARRRTDRAAASACRAGA
jgi:hypothetical protein